MSRKPEEMPRRPWWQVSPVVLLLALILLSSGITCLAVVGRNLQQARKNSEENWRRIDRDSGR